jgi:rod shape-determining protein MreB
LAADIIDRGIIMAGGGSLLRGLDAILREDTGLPVSLAEAPLYCVVQGVSRLLDDIDLLAKVSQ